MIAMAFLLDSVHSQALNSPPIIMMTKSGENICNIYVYVYILLSELSSGGLGPGYLCVCYTMNWNSFPTLHYAIQLKLSNCIR